jgi:sporulation protein YlmC with PRC-barrel domain
MESYMLKMQIAVGLAAVVLVASTAVAQTTAATELAGPVQVMIQMPPALMRGSRFLGLDVYGADNQKIGDVDEILVDRQGRVQGFVVALEASWALLRRMSLFHSIKCGGCHIKRSELSAVSTHETDRAS